MIPDWLRVQRGNAPLVVTFPHTGTAIPEAVEAALVSPWLARKDADWWIDVLYAFASDLGATVIATGISRTVIDVNRDPSGTSLYPGARDYRAVSYHHVRRRPIVSPRHRARRVGGRSADSDLV